MIGFSWRKSILASFKRPQVVMAPFRNYSVHALKYIDIKKEEGLEGMSKFIISLFKIIILKSFLTF